MNADGTSTPVLNLNIVAIDSNQNGLVDAINAQTYIDRKAANAKTVVEAGEGINVTPATDGVDGHTIYTIDSSLTLQYNGADGNNPATITLTGANGGVFGTVNVSDIVGNGVIDHTQYYPTTGELVLSFKTADGTTQDVSVDLTNILDLGDLMVKADSTNYMEITQVTPGSESDENQLSFGIKTVDVSDATSSNTGLVDAWDLKQYISTQTTDLTVQAQGDAYVDASIHTGENKKVYVTTNTADVSAIAGTAGVYGTDGSQTTAPSHGSLSGTANTLVDGAQAATAVKSYVDGEVAIEAARSDAYTNAKVAALDAEVTSSDGNNVTVKVTEVDGVITAVNVTDSYAKITYDTTTNVWSNTNSTGLVTGNDMNTMKSYVDDKVGDTKISAQGDGKYIDASVDGTDKKKINVAANTVKLGFNDPTDASATLTGTADKLVDAADVANKVTSFVNARIAEDIDALDSTVNVADVSNYVSATIAEANGLLDSTNSRLSVTYGTMGVTATGGIAKAEDVQTFVDTYDFWETYPAPANNNNG